MKEVIDRVNEYDVTMEVDESARLWLAEQGFDPLFGARPLKRALQKYVESRLAIKLLEGEFKHGDLVRVVKEEGKAELSFQNAGKADLEPKDETVNESPSGETEN
jgi:ATP-dependent Clp protease ATP-binding subunit ClpC